MYNFYDKHSYNSTEATKYYRLFKFSVSMATGTEWSENHHHHVVPPARISLTLSLHVSLSFIASGRSSGFHPVSSHSCCMYVRAGRPAFDWPYAGVHRSTSLMSSSLLLQQGPAIELAFCILDSPTDTDHSRDITLRVDNNASDIHSADNAT